MRRARSPVSVGDVAPPPSLISMISAAYRGGPFLPDLNALRTRGFNIAGEGGRIFVRTQGAL